MRIRIATVDDAPALATMRWEWRVEESDRASAEDHATFVAFAREGFRSGRWTAWVAEDQGVIVANLWVYRVPKVPRPGVDTRDFGYMTNVYTTPLRRGDGIGAELLDAVSAWARSIRLEMVIVWPDERRVPWYQRAGYAPSAEMHELEILGYEG